MSSGLGGNPREGKELRRSQRAPSAGSLGGSEAAPSTQLSAESSERDGNALCTKGSSNTPGGSEAAPFSQESGLP